MRRLSKEHLELREKGYTQEQIAKELRVTERTIRNWFAEAEKNAKMAKISASLLSPEGIPTPKTTFSITG